MTISRRAFAAAVPSAALLQAQTPTLASETVAQLSAELVKDWIAKAHQRKIDVMKGLLEREPALLQSSWDWGAGDFESAIQAAAHTGSRDMALFLIDRGARFDLFAAAMLGQLALLKTTVEAYPATLQVRGAHGIPLLSHAIQGEASGHASCVFGFSPFQRRRCQRTLQKRGHSADDRRANRPGRTRAHPPGQWRRRHPQRRPQWQQLPLSLAIKRGDASIIQGSSSGTRGATE